MHVEKPFWQSKKITALFYVGLLLIASLILKAPATVSEKLAEGILLGLPLLIGGQSYIDARARAGSSAATPPTERT